MTGSIYDRIIVDCWIRLNPKDSNEKLLAIVSAYPAFNLAKLNINFASWDFAPESWQERQRNLDRALFELAEMLDASDIPRDAFEGDQAELAIYLEFRPSSGTAGIALDREVLEPLLRWNAVFMMNAFPRHQDDRYAGS